MKNRNLNLFFMLFLGLLSVTPPVFADGTETGRITMIMTYNNDRVRIWLDGTNFKGDCGGASWILMPGDNLYNEKYSQLLAAANAQHVVTLYHVTSTGCGTWDSNRVSQVKVSYQ